MTTVGTNECDNCFVKKISHGNRISGMGGMEVRHIMSHICPNQFKNINCKDCSHLQSLGFGATPNIRGKKNDKITIV